MPPPINPNNKDILFADDVTQVIVNLNNDRVQLATDTANEIERINIYEKNWKISTNLTKFAVLSISKSRPSPIYMNDGRRIQFKSEIKILGLTLKRTGFVQHITNRIIIAKRQTKKIKRFVKLKTKTKMNLYKALVRPTIEYPVVPLSLASASQISKMQKVQNQNIRFITAYDDQFDYEMTMEEKHQRLQLEPINTRLYERKIKTWERFAEKETTMYEISQREIDTPFLDHLWWPNTAISCTLPPPPPKYL